MRVLRWGFTVWMVRPYREYDVPSASDTTLHNWHTFPEISLVPHSPSLLQTCPTPSLLARSTSIGSSWMHIIISVISVIPRGETDEDGMMVIVAIDIRWISARSWPSADSASSIRRWISGREWPGCGRTNGWCHSSLERNATRIAGSSIRSFHRWGMID